MKKITAFVEENWIISLAAVLLLAGLFYWYQWRPSEITKNCERQAIVDTGADMRNLSDLNIQEGIVSTPQQGDAAYTSHYNQRYQQCLRENGLEK